MVLVLAPRVFLRVLRFSCLHKTNIFQIRSGISGRKATLLRHHCKIPIYLFIYLTSMTLLNQRHSLLFINGQVHCYPCVSVSTCNLPLLYIPVQHANLVIYGKLYVASVNTTHCGFRSLKSITGSRLCNSFPTTDKYH